MKKAIWTMDYDIREDTMYDHPGCPDCETPIKKYKDEFLCVSCGNRVKVEDPEMIKWFADRDGSRTENWDCTIPHGCGHKGTLEVTYEKNPVTLKWQIMGGKCKHCGIRLVV